ncbi:hypothetical protein [Agrobacterium larrymoorei]|uniref:Uncharacterized protein n=1 Tax=Agrobacterium larrymoorei TaxID=160699 RepID=A0AAF0H6E1_9HYPH|nr:hypothetical protein [Agrobacterium larrymoorei]QYA06263.1 hypothetical protein J5285_09320 [Agrobacterium larrymoorei]WHA40358.1 hypothetical protein CFBP5477_011005 [Agrobacterium larrymoorei]
MGMRFSNSLAAGLRVAIMASIFLGPFAGLALYKAEPQPQSRGAGFVLLMSLQRGNLG